MSILNHIETMRLMTLPILPPSSIRSSAPRSARASTIGIPPRTPMKSRMMSEEKKPNRITAHYATDEDYKRMNFYTIGTL